MTADEKVRGTTGRGTGAGNPGVLIGTQDVAGVPYARYRASKGSWVSASLQEQGYAERFGKDTAYGAYTGIVRSPDGTPLQNPDRIREGQEYLVPILRHTQPAPAVQTAAGPRSVELFTGSDTARGTGNRYEAAPQQPRAPTASEAPPPSLEARAGGPALALLVARGLATVKAVIGGGGAVGVAPVLPLIAAGVAAAAGLGFGGYQSYRAFREWESANQARVDSEKLQRAVRQGVLQLWQNEVITDEEYLLYLSTGTLVVQPEPTLRRDSADLLGKRGTREYLDFGMKMLRVRFSETPALERLWIQATVGLPQSDEGYERARARFWKLIERGADDDARLIRAVLIDAGYLTPDGKAARVQLTWPTDLDPDRLAQIAKVNPDLAAKLLASAKEARKGRDPANLQEQQRKESIEHIIPRHPKKGSELEKVAAQYPNRFLDPKNLRFENLYENMLMGNKPDAAVAREAMEEVGEKKLKGKKPSVK